MGNRHLRVQLINRGQIELAKLIGLLEQVQIQANLIPLQEEVSLCLDLMKMASDQL